MKKRQKIIVVISCLALIFSVLAVNCFAWSGQGEVRYYNPLSTVEVDFRSSEVLDAVSRYSESVNSYNVVIPFNGDVPRLFELQTNYNSMELQLGDDPNTWSIGMDLDTTYSPSNSSVRCKNYLQFQRLSHGPSGNPFVVDRPEAIGAHLRYSSFILGEDMASYVKDNYTLRGFRDLNGDGGYSVGVYAVAIVPVCLVETNNYGESTYTVKNLMVEINADGVLSANAEVFGNPMHTLTYSIGNQEIEKNGQAIFGGNFSSVVNEYLASLDYLDEYYVMTANAYCQYADVYIHNDAFDGIAIQSYAEPTTNVSSELISR